MKEGSETKGGWKGLPFYTRVTIAGLLVFALLFTGINSLALVPGGVDSDAVERIVFYFLLMIPTVVVVVLTWRSRQTLIAAIGAILVLLITAPSIPIALGTFNSFFDAGLFIPVMVSLIVAGVRGYRGIPTAPSGRHPRRVHGRRAVEVTSIGV